MSTRFNAPEGYLHSNIGLLAGTVIRELRMHPYIDPELDGVHWNYKPEYLEFTVLAIQNGGYVCQYSGKEDTFGWTVWKEQPRYGFMDDGCTPVLYYIQAAPLPPPYESKMTNLSPYSRRCAEIDSAALLISSKNDFTTLASEPEVSSRDPGVFLERPSKKFLAKGGCPCYEGELNFGSGSNILCAAVREQLHGYVGVKFCEGGRKIYCPIWKAENNKLIVPKLGT